MSFSLTYEELLPRRLGRYELSLGLRPGQPVQNLTLDVSVTERTGISFIKAFPLKTSRLLSNTARGELWLKIGAIARLLFKSGENQPFKGENQPSMLHRLVPTIRC